MTTKITTVALLLLNLSACAMINSVSLTQVPASRSNMVTAQASRFIFFGFNFDNDYVDQVSKDLARKCSGGKISGILTKDETIMYFSVFAMTKRITATGYCEKGVAAL